MMLRMWLLRSLALFSSTLLATTAGAEEAPKFYRGINLNGPALTIDGRKWESGEAPDLQIEGHKLDNQLVALNPGTDRARARMIRSSRWGQIKLTLSNVPNGVYTVFAYVWEDNNAISFSMSLNGRTVVPKYESKSAGIWERLGPWVVEVTDGVIKLETKGGDANISGLEIWSGQGTIPEPQAEDSQSPPQFTAAALEHFEKKIRPLLAKNCYECHSAEAKELAGSLLLDSRPGTLKGGDSGPAVVPGDVEGSLLLEAVKYSNADLQMPPAGKLTATEIADLETWIKDGAADPRLAATKSLAKQIDFEAAKQFWSFRPVQDPPAPQADDDRWSRTAIDRFVWSKLNAKGMSPAPDADKRALLRRATFDLIGLPPSPEEMNEFLADDSPVAFARAVDRLLASPHYGERWGRHWLDLVRYADTSGCNSDFPVPSAWLYRNYVIDSFNADKPYDQFVQEQVAGDLLPHDGEARRQELIVATGYLAIGRRFGSLADEFHLTIEDNIDNLGKAVLGLSVSCARCHDHKFDPIPTADYYGLYGIFASSKYSFPGTEIPPQPKDFVPLVSVDEFKLIVQPWEEKWNAANKEVDKASDLKDDIAKGKAKAKPGETLPTLEEATKNWEAATERRDALRPSRPQYHLAYAVQEGKPADAKIQKKGDPRQPGELTPRHFLQVLGGQSLPGDERGSGRLQLAQWLTADSNPLTARVAVNRLWQYHFGKGLVRTPNDFGVRGQLPTHPELLDHLATRFMQSGWSIKAMHREIMLSRIYQTACIDNPQYAAADSKNELQWTFNRRRLEAEEYRDALLAVSGRLDRTQAEGHPFPPEPFKFTQHKPFYAIYDNDRRSVYLMQQRIKKHPWLDTFDGADPNAITAERPLNTTPLQALFAMNDPFVHEQAAKFAERLLKEQTDDSERIERAYELAYARPATDDEKRLSLEYLAECREALCHPATENGPPRVADAAAAWASLCRVILCGNEFSFVD